MPHDSEPDDVRQALSGSEEAFDALIGPLIVPAYRLALTMLRNPEDARDALQEGTLKAWSRLGQLRKGAGIRPWYLAIVANQCRTVRRNHWWNLSPVTEAQSSDDGPEDRVVRKTDLELALRSLPPSERTPLFLYFYLDLPLEEVANVLGVSTSAAKARVYRAVRRLRPRLEIQEAP